MGYITNVSWSFTRYKGLRGCLRAHWFGRYARGEPEDTKAKLLGTLVNVDIIVGHIVDNQVNVAIDALRVGHQIPADLLERSLAAFDRILRNSQRDAERIRTGQRLPRGAQPLLEDYYGIPRDEYRIERARQRVGKGIEGFLKSGILERLKSVDRARWKPESQAGEPSAVEFHLNGINVWVAPDFWLDYGNRGFVILDWKSGSTVGNEEAMQLAVYSLWGQSVRRLARTKVKVQAVHLPDSPDFDAEAVSESLCRTAEGIIAEQHGFELSLLKAVEASGGAVGYWADRDTFPPTPQRTVCSRCKFLELCPEGRSVIDYPSGSAPMPE